MTVNQAFSGLSAHEIVDSNIRWVSTLTFHTSVMNSMHLTWYFLYLGLKSQIISSLPLYILHCRIWCFTDVFQCSYSVIYYVWNDVYPDSQSLSSTTLPDSLLSSSSCPQIRSVNSLWRRWAWNIRTTNYNVPYDTQGVKSIIGKTNKLWHIVWRDLWVSFQISSCSTKQQLQLTDRCGLKV